MKTSTLTQIVFTAAINSILLLKLLWE